MLLNRLNLITEDAIIQEQSGFRSGKSCTSQLLNLTQHIEDGFEKSAITGTVFVDLSAAYVNHKLLLNKLYDLTRDAKFTTLVRDMLGNRRFIVDLNGQKSRWRKQTNGLPQGSVLSPVLFNIYTNDQPIHPETRSFIYADDLCITVHLRVSSPLCPMPLNTWINTTKRITFVRTRTRLKHAHSISEIGRQRGS